MTGPVYVGAGRPVAGRHSETVTRLAQSESGLTSISGETNVPPNLRHGTSGPVLQQLACLAASVTQTSASGLSLSSRRSDPYPSCWTHGLSQHHAELAMTLAGSLHHCSGLTVIPDIARDQRLASHKAIAAELGARFLVHRPLLSPGGEHIGFLCVLSADARPGLTEHQSALLNQVASLFTADRRREQRHSHLMHVANRALRVDRMLHLVSEAPTCADALSSLLNDLCRHHDAAVGRIWQVSRDGEALHEVSRFDERRPLAGAHGRRHPETTAVKGNLTAWTIMHNEQRSTVYATSELPAGCALDADDVASGLASQVDVPIWVEQQRFGITLAFTAERSDLGAMADDIASLADTIRPALFRKVTEERIRFVAHHDDLTQLANRTVFHERLSAAMATTQGEHGLALLYLDLDGFKLVNDSLGHEAGDRLLASVATRLRDLVRKDDTVARIGGDEFAIIQTLVDQPQASSRLADRVLAAIRQPFDLDGQRSLVGVSIGIALYPNDGNTSDLLLRNADTALYRAKEAGRNTYRFFEKSMGMRRQERIVVEQELKVAIAGQQFDLFYQPICDTAALEIRGFEALLRWKHPLRGELLPNTFIPLAETTGLIVPLGRWVLERACSEMASWRSSVSLSVNLSPKQFRQPDLAQQIAAILNRTGFSPDRLDLEVTEGLLLDGSDLVLRNMQAVREQGIRITLDDFGTAYASLSYLRRFPFDRIKIDKSFVQGMCDDDGTLAIVEAILSLSRRLGLEVVAEGVETEQQLQLMRTMDCRLVQGFFTGRPMTAQQTRGLLI